MSRRRPRPKAPRGYGPAGTLFGGSAMQEPANVRPDLRKMRSFEEELAAELRLAAAIRRNPFHGMRS